MGAIGKKGQEASLVSAGSSLWERKKVRKSKATQSLTRSRSFEAAGRKISTRRGGSPEMGDCKQIRIGEYGIPRKMERKGIS